MTNKTAIFDAIRYYVNSLGNEPKEGFVANELSHSITPLLEVSLEGRSKGEGVAIARHRGEVVAHEFNNTVVDGDWVETLLVQVEILKKLDRTAARVEAQNAPANMRWSNNQYTEAAKAAGGVLVIKKEAAGMNNTSALIQQLGIQANTAITHAPIVWGDHKGILYKLHEMETSHLVNILRLIVNEWAKRCEIAPVPIRNPQAVLNLKAYRLEQFSGAAKMFCAELIRRLSNGDDLSPGYQVVWDRVVSKILELLNCNAPLLVGSQSQLAIADDEQDEDNWNDWDDYDNGGHPDNFGDR